MTEISLQIRYNNSSEGFLCNPLATCLPKFEGGEQKIQLLLQLSHIPTDHRVLNPRIRGKWHPRSCRACSGALSCIHPPSKSPSWCWAAAAGGSWGHGLSTVSWRHTWTSNLHSHGGYWQFYQGCRMGLEGRSGSGTGAGWSQSIKAWRTPRQRAARQPCLDGSALHHWYASMITACSGRGDLFPPYSLHVQRSLERQLRG